MCMILLFAEIIDTMLYYSAVDENGNSIKKPRDISFTFRYRLYLNTSFLEPYVKAFNEARTKLVLKYGEANGDVVSIQKDKFEDFTAEIQNLLNEEVTLNVDKFEPSEFKSLKDVLDISEDAFKAFYCYLVEDEPYIKALETEVHFTSVKLSKTSTEETLIEAPKQKSKEDLKEPKKSRKKISSEEKKASSKKKEVTASSTPKKPKSRKTPRTSKSEETN